MSWNKDNGKLAKAAAEDALVEADRAKELSDYIDTKKPLIDKFTGEQTNLQAQVNKLVVEGDSSPQAAQASVGSDGTIYPTLKARLDKENNSVTAQLADIAINVTTFGAKFDNTTDDISSINQTIQHVKGLGGGTVLLPRGYAKISSPINHESNVILKGAGRDATFIVPTFTTGNVIQAVSSTKQKPQVVDLTIKPETYRYGLIGINYRYFQYGSVKRVDVFNCGVGYDFDGTIGCYYNKQIETRAVSCGYGVRTKDGGGTARANANEVDDFTALSPIIGVYNDTGNTNIFRNIKIESLETYNPHPTVDPTGATVTSSDRWMLKITRGTGSHFEKFRAEFEGNLVSLGTTYGHFLSDFYCNYNGGVGEFILLEESPTSEWQTNNLVDLELGYSSPVLSHIYYNRRSRLGQMVQLPPQIRMTPRDTPGAPTTGSKGLIRMDSNGQMWVGIDTNTFQKILYDVTAAYNVRGALKHHKVSTTTASLSITAKGFQIINISMGGTVANDNVSVSTNITVPDGLIVSPPKVDHLTFNVTLRIYNLTDSTIVLPAGTWTAQFVKP
ncbi:glycosyl hydrolase family 28-related protein [Psychrobacillus sp. BM2]|uniref:glycosyl hydrolase family 28-related protein n=1 Tax=Psychrobacillus sp. BM2 TaxID=3400421 RepID=UPI003B018693